MTCRLVQKYNRESGKSAVIKMDSKRLIEKDKYGKEELKKRMYTPQKQGMHHFGLAKKIK